MKFSDVRWLYFRLKAMSAGEIFHRLGEQAKRGLDSQRTFQFSDSPVALPVIPGLRDRVRACSDSARRQFRAVATEVREGRYHFLGRDWPMMGDLPDWHLDPVSGRRWPDRLFCYSVPFRHNSDYGDVKYVWELNRLQHLQFVAAAAVCDDDPELAQVCISQIRSWIDANPPFKGLNWSSGIELALRIVSLTVVFSLISPSSISTEDRLAVSASLRAHLYWLNRYPSRYSSANNHLVAEAAGLFLLGLLLPELTGSKDAETYGRIVLNAQALLQILPDGVPAEQSPTYGAFAAEWLLLADTVAHAIGRPGLDVTTGMRLQKLAEFLRSITDCAGNLPRIGDDDEGRVVADVGNTKHYLNSLTSILGRWSAGATGGSSAESETLQNLVFNVPATSPGAPPMQGVIDFSEGGYTVVREGENKTESLLMLDHGPLGYLSISAHGHADALSIWLNINGREILVDGGTYLYHSGRQWREHFRGTAAHSTLLIDGVDQSLQSGDFNWSAKSVTTLLECIPHLDAFRWSAEHDGYLQRFGLRHRRSVTRQGPGRYLVEDYLMGDSVSVPPTEVGFLLAPGLKAIGIANGWMIQDDTERSLLRIECLGEHGTNIQSGTVTPDIRGWVSPAFGLAQPTTRLVVRFADRSMKLTTLLTCFYGSVGDALNHNIGDTAALSN